MLDREILLIGDKINKLQNTTVLVLGLGGVGGYATEALVRTGIGHIIIVDHDIIDISNLNRQIISNINNIGQKKIDEWEKRIRIINPNIEITKIDAFITEDNIEMIFNNKPDYIIDACDTIKTKKELIRQCLQRKIKFISSMGTGNKFDPTRFKITDIRKTSYDPIAKILRKMVVDEHINQKIMVVASDEKPIKVKEKIGSISYVPSVAGLLCTSYIINDILR